MNLIREQKREIRKQIAEAKKGYNTSVAIESSRSIFEAVERLPEFQASRAILAYWSLPDEVNTHTFIQKWYKTKTILLPLVVGNDLELRLFTGMDCLEPQPPFGILEPVNSVPFSIETVDLIVVPGVAFDANMNRMGRGKGYYDKLLTGRIIFKVGVCFSFQMIENVPTEEFDVQMDRVIYF